MKIEQSEQQMICYDDALIDPEVGDIFDPNYWQAQGKILGSAQGRGTTWFVQTEHLAGALRHYRRGGLFGRLVQDSYWFQGFEKTRSYQEFQLLEHLIASNVNVPKPIAARAIKGTFCYQADILTQKVANARDLVAILQEKPIDDRVYKAIGQQIRHMHEANVNHTDLNIHNILVDDKAKVWIIDFDKCKIETSSHKSWQQGNLDRLLRSFEKEQKKRHIHWSTNDFKALKQGYASYKTIEN